MTDGSRSTSTVGADTGSLPLIPRPAELWPALSFWMNAAYALLLLAAVPPIVVDYWFFESIGQASLFRTNFSAQLLLFGSGIVLFSLAVALPMRRYAAGAALRKASEGRSVDRDPRRMAVVDTLRRVPALVERRLLW